MPDRPRSLILAVRDRFARIAAWCVEQPDAGRSSAVVLVALIGAVAALRLEPDAGTDKLVDNGSAAFRRPSTSSERFGDDAVVVLVKGDLDQLVLTPTSASCWRSRAASSGNVAGGQVFTDEPAPAPARRSPSSSRPRSCSARRPSSTRRRSRRPTCSRASPRRRCSRRARPPPRRASAPAAGPQHRAAAGCRAGGRPGGPEPVPAAAPAARGPVRPDRAAAPRRPDLRQLGRLRPARRRATPKAQFSTSVPERRRGADLDPAASPDLTESRAQRGDRPDPRRGRRRRRSSSTTASYVVSGVPVGRRGARRRARRARSSSCWSSALVVMALTLLRCLRPAAAAAAARDRARRGGAHLRAAAAARRLADDGLDRRAAGPDRPRGRLRDPVPGPLPRGARRGLVARRRAAVGPPPAAAR